MERRERSFPAKEDFIMPDINSLASRIDAEFLAVDEKIKKFQSQKVEAYKDRQQRLEQLGKLFDELQDIWGPRLNLLLKKFGDRVKVTPRVVPSTREATFEFQSELARVRLRFSATTDRDVQKLVMTYNLDIVPVLMRFTPHAEAEFPLTAVNKEAVGKWIDDRVVDFVQTYLALAQDEIYLKEQMVEDPVAQVRFPKMAAATTLEWQGQKYYFIGEETRREFEKQNKIAAK
jgi:YHS domain-containing protein